MCSGVRPKFFQVWPDAFPSPNTKLVHEDAYNENASHGKDINQPIQIWPESVKIPLAQAFEYSIALHVYKVNCKCRSGNLVYQL